MTVRLVMVISGPGSPRRAPDDALGGGAGGTDDDKRVIELGSVAVTMDRSSTVHVAAIDDGASANRTIRSKRSTPSTDRHGNQQPTLRVVDNRATPDDPAETGRRAKGLPAHSRRKSSDIRPAMRPGHLGE